MHEARIEETEHGLVPADDGWFILNVADIAWQRVERYGMWCSFESPNARSKTLGIGVHVLPPGETPGFYHAESDQEGFLVLSGECLAIVEGQERRMGPWDYFHCPPGTVSQPISARLRMNHPSSAGSRPVSVSSILASCMRGTLPAGG